MPITICPLATAWGTLADWSNVVVAIGVGIAVWILARRTYSLEHSLASQDDLEVESEKKILLIYVLPELVSTCNALAQIVADTGADGYWERFQEDADVRKRMAQFLSQVDMTVCASILNRMQKLGPHDGPLLARSVGTLRYLRNGIPLLETSTSPEAVAGYKMVVSSFPPIIRDLNTIIAAGGAAVKAANLPRGAMT